MVTQLIYTSEPFGYDDGILTAILAKARRKNPHYGITGALICRHDIYLQLIEGEADAIGELYTSILDDDRHLEVTLLNRAQVPDRLFPEWAMLHDPARSWLWTPEEVGRGAVRQATARELQQVFVRAGAEASAS